MTRLIAMLRRLADVNPVTLKELRQLVRSRLVLWAMILFPILLLAVDGLVVAASLPSAEPGKDAATLAYETLTATAGPGILVATLILLGIVTGLVIPLMTGVRLTLETGRARMDLQFVTALSAQDIVNGKLTAAFLLSLTFTSLALPFLTLAYLMRGLELATVAWSVAGVLAGSAVSAAFAAALGALRMPIGLRMAFLFGGYLAQGFWLLIACLIIAVDMAYGSSSWSHGPTAAIVVALAVAWGAARLARAWAASNLMPVHTDFKRGLRRLEAALLAVALAAALAVAALADDADAALEVPVVAGLALSVVGVLALFLPTDVPRLAAARAPKSFLGRLCTFPFVTTAASGALFAFLGVVLSLGALCAAVALADADADDLTCRLAGVYSVYGELMLPSVALALVLRACRAGRVLRAFGPLMVYGFMSLLQAAGILEGCHVIADDACVFGNLAGICDGSREAKFLHLVYATVGMAVFLPYLAVDVCRTFRRYRRPEAAGK